MILGPGLRESGEGPLQYSTAYIYGLGDVSVTKASLKKTSQVGKSPVGGVCDTTIATGFIARQLPNATLAGATRYPLPVFILMVIWQTTRDKAFSNPVGFA